MHGRSIHVFLVEGTPTGLRTVEVDNWTLKALVARRQDIGKLQRRPESERAGVYLLLGQDPETVTRTRVYIGESENVGGRQSAHEREKEFWDTAVFFVSQDNRLTKGHVRWLEAQLIGLAHEAGRAVVDNGTRPALPSLPEPDTAAMAEFCEQIVLVSEVLGAGVFPSAGWARTHKVKEGATGSAPEIPSPPGEDDSRAAFNFKGRDFDASMLVTGEAFLVLEGGEAAAGQTDTLQRGYAQLRQQLIDDGGLVPAGEGRLRFTRDVEFRSSSAAAGVVAGSQRSGRASWKLQDGRTLADWEDAAASSASDDSLEVTTGLPAE